MLAQMTVEELQRARSTGAIQSALQQPLRVIDVREPDEYEVSHVDGAELIPLAHLAEQVRLKYPDKETPFLLYCDLGIRSNHAAKLLRAMGYKRVLDLQGGMHAYKTYEEARKQTKINKRMIS